MCFITSIKSCEICFDTSIVLLIACDHDDVPLNSCDDICNYRPNDNETIMYISSDIPESFMVICGTCAEQLRNGQTYIPNFYESDDPLYAIPLLMKHVMSQLTCPDIATKDISSVGAYKHEYGHAVALICSK